VKKIFKYVKKVNMYGYNIHLREGRHHCWRCILVHLACSLHFGLDLIMELTHH
jgi:hypothetical protein